MNGKEYICIWYDKGFGCCCKNGSRCDYPFSIEGCKIQNKRIFKDVSIENRISVGNCYSPIENDEVLSRNDIFDRIGVIEGDKICEYFIPYAQFFDAYDCSPSAIIDNAWSVINSNLNGIGHIQHRMYHNVEIDNNLGVYFIGVVRKG